MPFVVTPDNVTLAMLELAQVGPQDFVLDLGSGDGRIVILAARRFGARGLGVEIVPDLVERSRRNAAEAGVAERAKFVEQDLFKTDLSVATVITMYLLQEVNLQLRPALLALRPGTRIVSHDWDMGDWQPDRAITVDAPDKPVGRDKRSRLHLWVVPARVEGGWCGTGPHSGARLRLAQRFQDFDRHACAGGKSQELAGRIDGARLRQPTTSKPRSTARGCTSASAAPCRRRFRAPSSSVAPVEGAACRSARTTVGALNHLACKPAQAGSHVQAQFTPCSRSWRSAAAYRSAAKRGSAALDLAGHVAYLLRLLGRAPRSRRGTSPEPPSQRHSAMNMPRQGASLAEWLGRHGARPADGWCS